MSNRKRINISIDPLTYQMLKQMKDMYGFNNLCEIVTSLIHILLDRMKGDKHQKYDIPEDDGAYIDKMFEDLSHIQITPDGNPPKRHNKRSKYGKG